MKFLPLYFLLCLTAFAGLDPIQQNFVTTNTDGAVRSLIVTNNYTPPLNLNGGLSVSNAIWVLPNGDDPNGDNPVVIKNDSIYDQNDGIYTGGEIVLDDGSGNLTLTAYGTEHQDYPSTWGHTTINGDLFNGTGQWGIYKNGQFWLAEGTSDQWSYIGNVDILNSDSANGYSSTIEDDGGKWAIRSDGLVTADALQIATGGQFNNSMINLHENIDLGQSEIVVGDANTDDAGTAGRISLLNDGFTETIGLNGIDGSASLLGGALSIDNTDSFFSNSNATFNLTGASDQAAVFQGKNLVLDDVNNQGAFLTLNSGIGSYITLEKNYDYGTCTQLGSDSSMGDGTFFFYKPDYGYAMQISVRDSAVYLNGGAQSFSTDGSASFVGGGVQFNADYTGSYAGGSITFDAEGNSFFGNGNLFVGRDNTGYAAIYDESGQWAINGNGSASFANNAFINSDGSAYFKSEVDFGLYSSIYPDGSAWFGGGNATIYSDGSAYFAGGNAGISDNAHYFQADDDDSTVYYLHLNSGVPTWTTSD